jgi:hypothetical protein
VGIEHYRSQLGDVQMDNDVYEYVSLFFIWRLYEHILCTRRRMGAAVYDDLYKGFITDTQLTLSSQSPELHGDLIRVRIVTHGYTILGLRVVSFYPDGISAGLDFAFTNLTVFER